MRQELGCVHVIVKLLLQFLF
ncbi:hypothetical protein F383_29673 [Gossypium arboreum]|uniref:Uncharacterized protein n=1 Tax=Gossypium arboreum TaxID=29729 RepID=A0A0B0MRW1_GOSAR|nr:hypothetical protein F383_29673 [Gossypium arboreum]